MYLNIIQTLLDMKDEIPHLDWILQEIKNSANAETIQVDSFQLHLTVSQTHFIVWYDCNYQFREADKQTSVATTRKELIRSLGLISTLDVFEYKLIA